MLLRKGDLLLAQLNKFKIKLHTRTCPSQVLFSSSKLISKTDNWKPIYQFPLIRWAAAFNKLKIYQIALTTVGVPLLYTLESASQLPDGSTTVFSALGITGCITLIVASLFTKNIIGIIYTNSLQDKVKLAYTDFWGKRKNIEISINEIQPRYEIPKSKLKVWYQPINIAGNHIEFKLIHRYGNIINSDEFSSIFGE